MELQLCHSIVLRSLPKVLDLSFLIYKTKMILTVFSTKDHYEEKKVHSLSKVRTVVPGIQKYLWSIIQQAPGRF